MLDVLILGGGPAGATAARLLDRWGHAVCLLDSGKSPAANRAESLPPSIARVLQLLEIREEVEAAGFDRSTGHTSWWGSAEPRTELFADGLGYHVLRSRLDGVLRELYAGPVRHVEARGFDSGRVLLADGEALEARFVIDCSGRAGVMGRAYRVPASRKTAGICALWRGPSPFPAAQTVIESYRDGWAWSVPVSDGARQVTFMVDYQSTALHRGSGLTELYRAEMRKTSGFLRSLEHAELAGEPWGWDASAYTSRQFAGENWLLAGDAGSFIDPLSSFGVRKAFGSAWLAAVAVHTALVAPERRPLAFEYYDEREKQLYTNFQRRSAAFFREGGSGEDFYSSRSEDAGEPFYRQADLADAWEWLRSAPELRLRPAACVRREVRAGIEGNEIVPREALRAPKLPAGLQFAQGVDLVKLVEIAPHFTQVPDMWNAYNRGSQPVDLPNFLGVLSLLVANEVLIHEHN
ncbi:MAG: tryptophan 7-halogenase [Bryobacteraceae bacterium]|nr:tryptophan 7-halogenase [Bryobacteraceae bacterium]